MRPLLAPAALAALGLAVVAPGAGAATTITLGPQLERAGISAPRTVTLPVTNVTRSAATTVADHGGRLRLRAGRRTATLSAFQVTAGLRTRLSVRLDGGPRRPLLRATGTTLQLSADGARAIGRRLGRRVGAGTIGRIALDRSIRPTRAAPTGARKVTGGTITWGYAPGLRAAFQAVFPPLTSGGVSRGADGRLVLPVGGGFYDAATRTGTVTSSGGFRIGYQIAPADAAGAHGIWVTLGNVAIDLDGDRAILRASSESGYHGTPVVPMAERTIATLSLTGITPTASADGRTHTWTAIPAALAPGGEELVAAFKDAPGRPSLGDVRTLDPVTITVQLA